MKNILRLILSVFLIMSLAITAKSQNFIVGPQHVQVGDGFTYHASSDAANWDIVPSSKGDILGGSQDEIYIEWEQPGEAIVRSLNSNGSVRATLKIQIGELWQINDAGNIKYNGSKVGIKLDPSYPLDVNGDIRAYNGWIRSQGDYGLYNNNDGTKFYSDNTSYFKMRSDRGLTIANRNGTRKGVLYHNNSNAFGLLDGDGHWGLRMERDAYTSFSINNSEKMRINSSGQVSIGTTLPKPGYSLSVAGKAVMHEVLVQFQGDWPDYVFNSKYNLMSLVDTKIYIQENKHLPNIPSAEEIKENGISIGEMNAKLLQKVEELTLHLIKLQERVEELESNK